MGLKRFSVSLDEKLVSRFDKEVKGRGYPTRSKAIADLINEYFVKKEWAEGKEVVGVITIVYNHHKRDLVNKIIDVQHDFHEIIISTQHVHLDDNNCVEIVVTKGNSKEIIKLADKLRSIKGVKHSSLTTESTGKDLV